MSYWINLIACVYILAFKHSCYNNVKKIIHNIINLLIRFVELAYNKQTVLFLKLNKYYSS